MLRCKLIFACLLAVVLTVDGSSVQRNPLGYLSIIENAEIHADSHLVDSLSSFELSFSLLDEHQNIKFRLEPNHDAIADGATVQYVGRDGGIRRTEIIDRTEHRIFLGEAYIDRGGGKWEEVGWARVSILRDGRTPLFEGAFQLDGDYHHIQTAKNYASTRLSLDPFSGMDEESMVLWRDSDIVSEEAFELRRKRDEDNPTCKFDQLPFNSVPAPISDRAIESSLFARQRDQGRALTSSIGSTAGCPTSKLVALMGVATDCTYTASFNSTQTVRENIISQVNIASAQYEASFNITLGIRNLTISEADCPASPSTATPWNIPCDTTTTIADRLSLFSQWRGDNSDSNAFWTLLSTCNTDSAVGLAWLGQACNPSAIGNRGSTNGADVVSSTNIVVRTSAEWQVIAHEVGHTFGAVHDCTSATCADGVSASSGQCCPLSVDTCDAGGQFIMNPSSSRANNRFSQCSIGNICSAIGSNLVSTSCLLRNRNVTTITGGICGNGIVEVDEQCDCGGPEGCGDNPCCEPTTCRFRGNAVCDIENDDCCSPSCQFQGTDTVCRPSTGSCDPQETCSGTSASCPADIVAENGESCGSDSSLYCASGECTSRDAQCRALTDTSSSQTMSSATNFTQACFANSCRLSCNSGDSNVCWTLQSNVVDGTECGSGRRCFSGVCRSSSSRNGGGGGGGNNNNGGGGFGNGNNGSSTRDWWSRNRNWVIGVSAGLGGALVLLIVLCCIWSSRRKSKRRKQAAMIGVPAVPPGNQPMPPMRSNTAMSQRIQYR